MCRLVGKCPMLIQTVRTFSRPFFEPARDLPPHLHARLPILRQQCAPQHVSDTPPPSPGFATSSGMRCGAGRTVASAPPLRASASVARRNGSREALGTLLLVVVGHFKCGSGWCPCSTTIVIFRGVRAQIAFSRCKCIGVMDCAPTSTGPLCTSELPKGTRRCLPYQASRKDTARERSRHTYNHSSGRYRSQRPRGLGGASRYLRRQTESYLGL
ncbi:hypothetical protein C8Q77DRAFT_576404 [Trametes polyzona]|nr:hypothetical protein C8Q77DRAFT_576404 [Trametes polyzona]